LSKNGRISSRSTPACACGHVADQIVVVALGHLQAHAGQVGMAAQVVGQQVDGDVGGDADLEAAERRGAGIQGLQRVQHLDHRRVGAGQHGQCAGIVLLGHHAIDPPPLTRRFWPVM
jgi:hypothetical protein